MPLSDSDLQAFLDGSLTDARRRALEADPATGRDLARLSAIRERVRDEVPISIVGRAETIARLRRTSSRVGIPRWVWAAGTIAVGGLLLLTTPKPPPASWGYVYAREGGDSVFSPPPPAKPSASLSPIAPPYAGESPAAVASATPSSPKTDGSDEVVNGVALSGTLVLRTLEVLRAKSRADAAAVRLGGAAVESSVSRRGDRTSGAMTLRVPKTQLAPLMAEMKRLGRVLSESSTADDLRVEQAQTAQRRSGLLKRERGLKGDLEQSSSPEVTRSLEKDLARIRRDLQSLGLGEKILRERIAFATLRLRLDPGP